eukprot:11703825-Alexandrium_andersonii.AAC.1
MLGKMLSSLSSRSGIAEYVRAVLEFAASFGCPRYCVLCIALASSVPPHAHGHATPLCASRHVDSAAVGRSADGHGLGQPSRQAGAVGRRALLATRRAPA